MENLNKMKMKLRKEAEVEALQEMKVQYKAQLKAEFLKEFDENQQKNTPFSEKAKNFFKKMGAMLEQEGKIVMAHAPDEDKLRRMMK